MALYTRASLKQEGQRFAASLRKSSLEILHESYESFSEYKTYDIFMSHSILNGDEIIALKKDIEGMGFSVYVDWIEDPHLDRSKVTKQNAEVLRIRMNCCRSLFFATSEVSPSSKWMPWELGYFDGKKEKAAILPVLEVARTTENYQGQEYLGLYPYVTKAREQKTNKETLWIHEDENTYVSFSRWLEGTKPFRR